ncbi:lycopene cyclase family protein [Umezawaea endophytica]|uniref:Lycopene cyclase family protein n=1 Tax=Umezawaea endophytica TaxID=1654476 RepID=A0A9X2VTZ5_9PSEU|nr:lycopene cyclase family protein [Umezawaea endophytica]MCS7481553.1 lycopene cyclase family protein [Umezawaea endophytica]
MDVIVLGGGPAGRALAGSCAEAGLETTLVDPRPDKPWTSTYGAWADELPKETPIAVRAPVTRAIGVEHHVLDREYVVLDNTRLHLLPPAVRVEVGKSTSITLGPHRSSVRLADGRTLTAALVVDATGAPPSRGRVEQTAAGVVVTKEEAKAVLDDGEALIMDWRQPPVTGVEWPTFLYAVPLGPDRVLLEETSLARRPGLPVAELRTRLASRLAGHGIAPTTVEEQVRFPVDLSRPTRLTFGAAAALVHPATGYSVATTLTLAPLVAEAVADALPKGPRAARAAAKQIVWSPAAKLVHTMRRHGLRALLAMPPEQVPEFFDLFFRLPDELRRSYLSDREDVAGATKAMAELFRHAPWRLRRTLVLAPQDR